MNLDLLLLIVAFVCFLLEALKPVIRLTIGVNLIALGLALWVLTLLV